MNFVSATNEVLNGARIGLISTLLSTAQSYRGAGIHTYSHQLLQHLPGQFPGSQFSAFVGTADYQSSSGVSLHPAPSSERSPYARIFWEQTLLPLLAARQHLQLLHGLAYAAPLLTPLPTVVTVHDLSFLHFPQAFHAGNRLYLSRITALSCRRARRVIAVSQATAADLTRLLGIPSTKIDVVYNGVDDLFHPLPPHEITAIRAKQGWPEQFILCLGTLEPRKNHVVLLEAYAHYRHMSERPLPLLIGGGKGWYFQTIFERVKTLGLEAHVHFLGFVPARTLPWLYNAASLFVYPSRYEGFGLPVAEAMACGIPAITSTASSLPEVAGDAAPTLDPDDPEALAAAMHAILSEPARAAIIQQKGLARARQFRWAKTAADTAAVYARTLGEA